MYRLCMIFLLLFTVATHAQYKTYHLSSKGDTLNAVDMKGLKQGKWTVHVAALRGEPAYEEEGVFVNDKKEGTWYKYNLMGDPLAIENFKWGNKNGLSRYFTPSGPEHDESWRAVNPSKSYDTIDVVDPRNPNKYEKVIVKNEGVSMRHGTWKYYYPPTGKLLSTESYFLDKLQEPGSAPGADLVKLNTDSTKLKADTAKPAAKAKPKEVLDFEKKTSGKKKALRDGRTGG
jgi:hypothetical protein